MVFTKGRTNCVDISSAFSLNVNMLVEYAYKTYRLVTYITNIE